ncbi:hypothetical protein ACOSQ4_009022 [Xanthoceras sorbifolium]
MSTEEVGPQCIFYNFTPPKRGKHPTIDVYGFDDHHHQRMTTQHTYIVCPTPHQYYKSTTTAFRYIL